jgi:hypothetical protein
LESKCFCRRGSKQKLLPEPTGRPAGTQANCGADADHAGGAKKNPLGHMVERAS